jgi:hypothetical protein
MIGAENLVPAARVIELDHGGATVARMQLDAEIGVMLDDVDVRMPIASAWRRRRSGSPQSKIAM